MNNEAILQNIQEEFFRIQQDENLEQLQKDMRSAELMTLLENYMNVPILNDEVWIKFKNEHPDIAALYEEISSSRLTLWQ